MHINSEKFLALAVFISGMGYGAQALDTHLSSVSTAQNEAALTATQPVETPVTVTSADQSGEFPPAALTPPATESHTDPS